MECFSWTDEKKWNTKRGCQIYFGICKCLWAAPSNNSVCTKYWFSFIVKFKYQKSFLFPCFFTKPPTPSLLCCCCLERSLSVVVSFQHAPYCKNTVMSYLFIYSLEICKCCDIRSRFCTFLRVRSCTCSIAVSRSYSGHVLSVYVLCSYKPSPLSAPDWTFRVLPSISKPLFGFIDNFLEKSVSEYLFALVHLLPKHSRVLLFNGLSLLQTKQRKNLWRQLCLNIERCSHGRQGSVDEPQTEAVSPPDEK